MKLIIRHAHISGHVYKGSRFKIEWKRGDEQWCPSLNLQYRIRGTDHWHIWFFDL